MIILSDAIWSTRSTDERIKNPYLYGIYHFLAIIDVGCLRMVNSRESPGASSQYGLLAEKAPLSARSILSSSSMEVVMDPLVLHCSIVFHSILRCSFFSSVDTFLGASSVVSKNEAVHSIEQI